MKHTKIKDYLEKLHELYPLIKLNDLKRIVNYGWSMIYLCNSYGCDVNISDKKFKCFIGKLQRNGIYAFKYYANKLARKIRFMYRRRGIKWDGYYYFGLSKNQFQEYLKLIKDPRRKNITFNKLFLYKIFEECKVAERSSLYFFRVKWPCYSKQYTKYYETVTLKDVEFIMSRDPLRMYDLLTSYNKFKYL